MPCAECEKNEFFDCEDHPWPSKYFQVQALVYMANRNIQKASSTQNSLLIGVRPYGLCYRPIVVENKNKNCPQQLSYHQICENPFSHFSSQT